MLADLRVTQNSQDEWFGVLRGRIRGRFAYPVALPQLPTSYVRPLLLCRRGSLPDRGGAWHERCKGRSSGEPKGTLSSGQAEKKKLGQPRRQKKLAFVAQQPCGLLQAVGNADTEQPSLDM